MALKNRICTENTVCNNRFSFCISGLFKNLLINFTARHLCRKAERLVEEVRTQNAKFLWEDSKIR